MYSNSNINLKIHAVLVGDDGPAIADLCGTKRPANTKVPCRAWRESRTDLEGILMYRTILIIARPAYIYGKIFAKGL